MMLELLLGLLSRREAGTDPRPRPTLKRSDRFVNASLLDQFGRRVHFRDAFVDGRALIVNTMYTVCRGSCPGTSNVLRRLREALSPIFPEGLSIVSLTLDPATDDPDALRAYARIYDADRPRKGLCEWRFLTGAPAEVDRLRRSLGFYDLDPKVDGDLNQHASLLLFGNTRTDRWAAMPSQLREPLLIETARRICGTTFEQKYGVKA